jgi:Amt family ammonium transporter
MYFIMGYNLMYTGVDGGYFGLPMPFSASEVGGEIDLSTGYASASDWFFQMVFVATAISIVSGAIAERIRLLHFFVFAAILSGVLYPITGAWTWGGGWLSEMGFADFAGSTIVHSVGGWAALAGCILLGPRLGRYVDGRAVDLPGSSLPLATLGTFVLWFGWFGFNGGSQLALGSAEDAAAVAQIFANTNVAAAAGVVTAAVVTKVIDQGKINIGFVLNGALAGLVAITAEPLTPSLPMAALIGAVGSIIAIFGMIALERVGVDDVVGAIPVHLMAGAWGTLAVPLTNPEASFITQLIGILAIGAFTTLVSAGVWFVLVKVMGARLSPEEEERGGDLTELGHEAYPEFVPRGNAPKPAE